MRALLERYSGKLLTPHYLLLQVRALLERYFGKPVNTKLNPDEAVAYGAAVQV